MEEKNKKTEVKIVFYTYKDSQKYGVLF